MPESAFRRCRRVGSLNARASSRRGEALPGLCGKDIYRWNQPPPGFSSLQMTMISAQSNSLFTESRSSTGIVVVQSFELPFVDRNMSDVRIRSEQSNLAILGGFSGVLFCDAKYASSLLESIAWKTKVQCTMLAVVNLKMNCSESVRSACATRVEHKQSPTQRHYRR